MKLSDFIAGRLREETDVIFGFQGSSISHLIDSICSAGIKYIQNYHEQASAFAACGYAETNDQLGVAVSCSGPGATNLITGIANAFYDSLPCLFISGQVSTHEMKNNAARQNGFQETKILDIIRPITKYCVEITDPSTIKYELEKCIAIAKSGRPGPTFLSLPHDIQSAQIDVDKLESYENERIGYEWNEIDAIANLIRKANKPLFIIGGGAHGIKNNPDFQKFCAKYRIPYVASLRGLNNVPFDSEYVGFIGVYGNREANLAVYKSDLLIVLGSRLDSRQTGGVIANFAPEATIVHVDIDAKEINREVQADYALQCDCLLFIQQLYQATLDEFGKSFSEWHQSIRLIKDASVEGYDREGVNPMEFVRHLHQVFSEHEVIVSTDVGQNQMWVAQAVRMKGASSFLTSGGHGSMGYSLPAIIGGYFASFGNKPLIAYMGDGGLQMNIQELETLKRENIPATIVVFVNNSLGLIRDYQEKALGNRVYGSVWGFSVPDLKALAECYDLDYIEVSNQDFSQVNDESLFNKRVLIKVNVSGTSIISPELAYQKPIYDQRPHIDLSFLNEI